MSVIDNLMELWQANGQEPHQTQGQLPNEHENVPHGTHELFDPLSAGASKAIEQVRKNVGYKKKSLMRPLVELMGNLGTAGLRSSDSPMAQELGRHDVNPYAEEDAQVAQNMQIMQFLAQQEQARRMHELQQQRLAEEMRYHRAYEEMDRQKALRPNKEELTDQAIYDLQQKIPGAIPMSALPVGARTDAYKELRQRANRPAKLYSIQKSLDEMVKIASEYPNLSTSYAAALFPEHYKGGILNTAQLKTMPHKERVALERFNKLSNDLVVKQVHGLGSQRASIFLERIMKASNPHSGLTPDAIRAIRDANREDYDLSVADSKLSRAALAGTYYIPEAEPEELPSLAEPEQQAQVPMVEITNKKTGEKRRVTLQEARQLGAIEE